MKEFGAQIALEGFGKEYFSVKYDEKQILRLNSARYAIIASYYDGKYDKIWVPVYMCSTVTESLDRYNIPYVEYNINSDFTPYIESIPSNDCIMITNYFGLMDSNTIKQMVNKFKNVIFDNSQAFYSCSVIEKNVYNVYSPRKFFGVADGAYVVAKQFNIEHNYDMDLSYERVAYLAKAKELGNNATYEDYLINEKGISEAGIMNMSVLTQTILSNVDYNMVFDKRRENYLVLNEALSKVDINSREFKLGDDCVPMIYPLIVNDEHGEFRKYLISNNVYVSQWWKRVLQHEKSNDFEKEMSQNLFPIPIDQRYSYDDIMCLVDIISAFWR